MTTGAMQKQSIHIVYPTAEDENDVWFVISGLGRGAHAIWS